MKISYRFGGGEKKKESSVLSNLLWIAETALMTGRQETFSRASLLVLRVMLTCP